MLIKDVLVLAAEEVGRPDLAEQVEEAYVQAVASDTRPTGETATLLRCYHLVENEVAIDHFPLTAEQTFVVAGGEVPFSQFDHAPVDVLAVSAEGREVRFRVCSSRLVLPERAGRVDVRYSYAPSPAMLDGETAFPEKISARLLSYGVACEYLMAGGRYAEAEVRERKFCAALRAAGLVRRKLRTGTRRWA